MQDMDPVERAEKIIDDTYIRYKTIFENTGTATILIENDMTISMVNSELTRISGIEKSRIQGKMKFYELIDEADRERVIAYHHLRREAPEKAPRNYPCRLTMGDGDIRECILTVALIQGTRQSVASITDMSKQKRLEREISRIAEEERRQMGQILHDDLGSHLAGVEAMSSLLAARLEKQGHGDAELAGEIRTLVNQAIEKTRAMVRGLLPVNLADAGFMNAVKRFAGEVETAFDLPCRIRGETGAIRFSNTSALTHVYYIIREAVNNAAKHSRPSGIDICFDRDEDDMVVDIRDDGKGLNAGGVPDQKGVGLTIMQHRADLIGARLDIRNTPEGGTRVRCRIGKKYLS
ncbi:MAG TPA: hypothetical protein DHV36_11500 [Desulfobacteraceae bacterium]|nr:hypothetical protein [Desulfobacteraceae bacterium]